MTPHALVRVMGSNVCRCQLHGRISEYVLYIDTSRGLLWSIAGSLLNKRISKSALLSPLHCRAFFFFSLLLELFCFSLDVLGVLWWESVILVGKRGRRGNSIGEHQSGRPLWILTLEGSLKFLPCCKYSKDVFDLESPRYWKWFQAVDISNLLCLRQLFISKALGTGYAQGPWGRIFKLSISRWLNHTHTFYMGW